jgi:hypothetical protein
VPLDTPHALGGGSSSGYFPQDVRMTSCPAGWVRDTYSHPGWIPLLTDRCGNYIGIDLDPPVWEEEEVVNGGFNVVSPVAEFVDSPRQSITSPTGSSRPSLTSPTSSKPPSRAPSPVHPLMPITVEINSSIPLKSPSNSVHSLQSIPASLKRNRGGVPGQVIVFGREIDEKVVLYGCEGPGGWGRFLRGFAEDVERGGRGFAVFGTSGMILNRGDGGGRSGSEDISDGDDGIGEIGYLDSAKDGAEVESSEDEGGKSGVLDL